MHIEAYPKIAETAFPTGDLIARIRELEAELHALRTAPPKRARRAKDAPDWRTAAECWLAGEAIQRPSRAAYRKGKAQTVRVDFADGESARLSTYIDGPAGIAEAVRTARASRQYCAPAEDVAPAFAYIANAAGGLVVRSYKGKDAFECFSWGNSLRESSHTLSSNEYAAIGAFCRLNGLDYEAAVDAGLAAWRGAKAAAHTPQWVRDTKGAWRCVAIRPCPDVIAAEFVDAES